MIKRIRRPPGRRAGGHGHSQADRASVFAMIEEQVHASEDNIDDEDLAFDEFWGAWRDREEELPDAYRPISSDVYVAWFAFDRKRDDGSLFVDALLDSPSLSGGERRFMEAMRESSMRLYEVVDAVPGISLTLRDLLEGGTVTVSERTGSRTIDLWDWIGARVIPRGVSGKPEIEMGIVHITRLVRDSVRAQLTQMRDGFRAEEPGTEIRWFYKEEVPPFLHDAWVGALLDPPLPRMVNTDGEELLVTTVTFDVVDEAELAAKLGGCAAIEATEPGHWIWSGDNREGKPTLLGALSRSGTRLVVETNSVARAERARALIESLAPLAIRHRSTTHADPIASIRQTLHDGATGRFAAGSGERGAASNALPPEAAEALVLDHLARHYRAWLDEGVPALDGRTPREVARTGDAPARQRLVDLLHGLEGMYLRALRSGEPAYDPSWMWRDLELVDEAPRHPPLLAHERVAELLDCGGLAASVAQRRREASDFDDASTLLSAAALGDGLDVQRFLRGPSVAKASAHGIGEAALRDWLLLIANFELHRRKLFWVDESLAYALDHSDIDVLGRELRSPFASCAFVFTDRHVLSLAERLLARPASSSGADGDSPLAGQLLRVVTVYVTDEQLEGGERALAICFAADALGADPPVAIRYRLQLGEDERVAARLDAIAPASTVAVVDGKDVPDGSPLRALLRVVINAVLYATNAGRDAELRAPPARRGRGGPERPAGAPVVFSSDGVFFLPGAIEISSLRSLQQLERSPSGREYVHRFLVRGHWRRPAPGWSDQRLRWIAPYWKGPSLAATVERLYKMKP